MLLQSYLSAMVSSLLLSLCVTVLLQLVHGSTDCVHAITVDLNFSSNDSCNTAGNICGSLQSAIDTLSTSSTEDNCTLILLPPGTHYISAPRLLRTGVHLRGTADNVTVSCSYSSSNDTKGYSWYFRYSTMVVFEGLNFEECPYPFCINGAATVSVDNCSFRYFTEAVLDIYNCQSTSLTNSSFVNNTGTGISNSSYRGNTGAVSFGFNNVPSNISFPNVRVSGCNFTNNSATEDSVFRTSSETFSSQIFIGRGGALGVFINESFYNISVVISDCRFEHNYARSFGGSMYFVFNGFNTQHTISVDRTHIVSNTAVLGGGGIDIPYGSNGLPGLPHTVTFTDCVFDRNKAAAGGGLHIYVYLGDENFLKLERCNFTGNQGLGSQEDYGAALALSLQIMLREKESLRQHEVVDCTFAGNYGTNGIISVGYTPTIFRGRNRFIRNSGTSTLRVVGTVVDLFGTLEFINNTSPQDEAALHLLSFGQVRLQRGLDMTFAGNIGRFGASILLDTPTFSTAFEQLLFNPQCFVLYEVPATSPFMWTDVTIRFRNNTAVLGSALLLSRLGPCSWFSLAPPYFNKTSILDWSVWDFGNDSVNTGYPDPMNSAYSVKTAPERLTSTTTSIARWPGFKFPLDLSGMDEFNHLTAATACFYFTPPPESNYTVNFDPEIVIVDSDPETGILTQNFILTYTISSATELQLNKSMGRVDIRDPFETVQVLNKSFVLYPLPCPGGYTLVLQPLRRASGSMVCQCQENVTQVIHCENDQDTVVIENGYWAVFTPSISGSNLEFYPCPPGYCACTQYSDVGNTTCVYTYTNTDPDRQCTCDRKGVLCGQCRGDKGVSALLNKCVSCHDASGLLIAGLIIADAVVFIVLTLLDHPLPSWIYPFLFYLQLAPYVTDYFPESFETVGEYLHFASSASGFYFVYDFCLYGNMSALVSYFIRYLPLFVALLLCPLVVLLRKCRLRLIHHHGLWWILLLLYSHLVHTSMSILDCPMLRDSSDQTVRPRWFINGEVSCFTGPHLPLALLAMAVLLLCFLLIPLTTIISLDILKKLRWLRHFVPPLTAVFREEVKWWSGVELGRRFLFLLFFIPFPRNAASPTLVLAIIITVYGFVQPYKSRAANLLEMGVQVNFLLLLLIEATSNIRDLHFTFPSLLQSNVTSEPECVDSLTGIAPITWILMPFYYLPLLVFTVVACITFTLYIRERLLLTKPIRLLMDPQAQDDNELEATEYHHYTHEMFFQSLSPPRSQSGSFALTNNSTISEGTKD